MNEHLGDAADVLLPIDALDDAQLAQRVDLLQPVAHVLVLNAAGPQAIGEGALLPVTPAAVQCAHPRICGAIGQRRLRQFNSHVDYPNLR